MHTPVLVEPPATSFLGIDEVKAHLRETSSDQDTVIQGMIDAAVALLDGWTGILGRGIITQSWRQDFDDFHQILKLPMPASAVSGIVHVDKAGAAASIGSGNYELQANSRGSFVRFIDDYDVPTSLAETRGVRVTFTTGFGEAPSDVPAALRVAAMLMIGHWFNNREAVADAALAEIPLGANMLLAPYRRVGV